MLVLGCLQDVVDGVVVVGPVILAPVTVTELVISSVIAVVMFLQE